MDPETDGAALDEQVSYLRARWRAARAQTNEPGGTDLVVELTRVLALRHDGRLAAGDEDGAAEDLNDVVECARTALAALSRPAGGECGDPDTIAEVQAILGSALGYRFAVAQDQLDERDSAALAAARADRDEAIAVTAALLRSLPSNDPGRPEIALMAGQLSYDRYTDLWPDAGPPDPADLDTACDLLLQGVADHEADKLTTLYLVHALRDRLDLLNNHADRDAFITWGERLLSFPDAAEDDWADLHDMLGTELLDRAESTAGAGPGAAGRLADLDAAIRHLEAVLAATAAGESGHASLLYLLAHACWLRVDGDDSRYAEVDRMEAYARRAWAAVTAGGGAASGEDLSPDERALLGFYLGTGLNERLRRPGVPFEPDSVDLAISVLTEIEPLVAGEAGLHLITAVMLGSFLIARGQAMGSTADLVAAQSWLLHAAGEVSAGDPELSQMAQAIGNGLFVLASSGVMTGPLDRAIEFLDAAAARPDDDADHAAVIRAGLGMALLQRGALDQESRDVGDGIAHMVAAHDLARPNSAVRVMISWNLGSALLTRFNLRGDRQDLDAAQFYLQVVGDQTPGSQAAMSDLVPDFDLTVTAARGAFSATKGLSGDVQALDQAVDSFRAALAMVPAGHPQHARLRSDLGLALLMRAGYGSTTTADISEAMGELEAAVTAMPAGHMMRTLAMFRAGGALAVMGLVTRDPQVLRQAIDYLSRVLAEPDPFFGEPARIVGMLGMTSAELYELTGDPVDRDTAVTRLAEACRELEDRPGHPQHANLLSRLARVHRACGDAGPAREQGLAALRVRVRDVLLQTGTARALASARAVAAEAAEVADWCLGDHEPGLAVQALELGRGLVLHAATSAADLPELLSAAGRDDLAREWRQAASSGTGSAADGGSADGGSPWDDDAGGPAYVAKVLANGSLLAPSDLRGRALAALARSAAAQDLLAPTGPAQIAAALTRTNADALVYLLPPSAGRDGRALLVAAEHVTAVPPAEGISLPLLRPGLSSAFDEYAASHAEVLAIPPEPADGTEALAWAKARVRTVERWEGALGVLCEWAWPTVVKPVLDRVASWPLGHHPRLVLTPIGPLSLVPWHAARSRRGDDGSWSYACAEAVISYAASARQLLEVSCHPARPFAADPVIVADPTAGLGHAIQEAEAIRDCCYPSARYLGSANQPGSVQGEGRPDEVLAALPAAGRAGASILHVGCHANVVGSAPGQSHLVLADHEQLRVDAILTHARGRSAGLPGGLVSLAACRTDLAADDYDEALTLATAFLAAGAVTVVGARWEIPDKATALLMFMYHYFMVRCGHPPRDALRLAQLWMTDPHRVAPPEMPSLLAERAGSVRLANLTAWAGFTHQGR